MKKILSLLFPLATLISGCNLEEIQDQQMNLQDERIFTASFEQNETRTYVENGNLLRWNAGDQITIFEGNTLNRKYQFDGETGDNGGTFSIVSKPFGTGNDLNCHFAVYPYASDVKITENGVITATLPAEQNYAGDSFGLGANTMVAVTKDLDDTFLKFKNVGGYLKLQLYGENVTVKSITLKGNSNEKLAGKATITPAYVQDPTVVMGNDASASITLDCGEGVTIGSTEEKATAFWIVVPPTTFKSGFTVTITNINGETFIQDTSNEIAIERNVIKPMKTFEVTIENEEGEEEDGTIPNNQIWYTATAKVEPYWNDVFGANIVSNTWDPTSGNGIITFDSDVTKIGKEAFYQCTNLTSVIIPDKVTIIDEGAFDWCDNLTDVHFGVGIVTIGNKAFEYSNLGSVNIPNNVTSIGAYAFFNCSNLENLAIGKNVTSIGEYAFRGGYYESVTIPESVTSIGTGAFKSYSIKEFKGKFASTDGRCIIIDGTLTAFAHAGLTEYIIPNNVTSIGKEAFQNCEDLIHITIPNSVISICDGAFDVCKGLTSITIPDSVISLGSSAFNYCENLSNITLGSSLETIGTFAFSGCNFTDIIIPESVITIEQSAFYGCRKLSNITIANSVTTIGSYVFQDCSNLTDVIIPDSVTNLGLFTFQDCSRLKSVTIGRSLKNMYGAFLNCSNLESVYCNAEIPPIVGGLDTFKGCSSNLTVYVSTESLDAYKSADYWKDMNIIGVGSNNDQFSWFNPDQYITYVANYEVIEPNADDWYEYSSSIDCPITPFSKIEMKFEMVDDGSTCYLCCRNRARDNTSAIYLDRFGLTITDEDEEEIRDYDYSWEEMNVKKSDLMTITISFKDQKISVNDKELTYKMTALSSFKSGLLFSYYTSENDEGTWRVLGEGVPEGSKLYYVKIWDQNGDLAYLGAASKALNPKTNQEEYCWQSHYTETDNFEFAYYPTTHSNYSPYNGGIDK